MRLTEGVICGTWEGNAVSGGSEWDGGDGELGLAGLLKRYEKHPSNKAKGQRNDQQTSATAFSHLPMVMGKKGTLLVLRCSSAVMAASRARHMLWPSSDSSTYSRLSGLRPLSPTSPFTVYDFPLFSTTRTSSDVLWVFAPTSRQGPCVNGGGLRGGTVNTSGSLTVVEAGLQVSVRTVLHQHDFGVLGVEGHFGSLGFHQLHKLGRILILLPVFF